MKTKTKPGLLKSQSLFTCTRRCIYGTIVFKNNDSMLMFTFFKISWLSAYMINFSRSMFYSMGKYKLIVEKL